MTNSLMQIRSMAILVPVLLLSCCARCKRKVAYENYAEKYQLSQSSKYSYQFERAILDANAMLPDTFRYRLVPTWETSLLSPVYTFYNKPGSPARSFESLKLNDSINECRFLNYRSVPVYLINDDKLGTSENAFVPDNEQCIFVNARFIDTIWKDFGLSYYQPDRRHEFVLALILLHELGHLNNGDSTSYTNPGIIDWNSKVFERQLKDNQEYKADMFAIRQIQSWKTASRISKVFLGLTPDYLSGDFYRALAYGRTEFEVNRDILGYSPGKRHSLNFQPNKYSHPNLYLRFLLMNYALSKDSDIIKTIRESSH
jgi:hypothetical protein